MEKPATDVALPPIRGGDLPSFDELLAKGSFHARLARARVEREKALAAAGDSDAEDFILNTARKPWERQKAGPAKGDRLTVALEGSAAIERTGPAGSTDTRPPSPPETPRPRVVPLRPDARPAPVPVRVPAGTKAPAERGLHALPSIRPVEPPAKSTAAPRKRALMVAGGFAAGMAIGIVATMSLSRFQPAPAGLRGGAPSFSTHAPVSLPAAGTSATAETAGLEPAMLAAAPATLVRPASPVAPDADSLPGPSGLAAASSATRLGLGPVLGRPLPDAAEPAGYPSPAAGLPVVAPGAFGLVGATRADALPVVTQAAARPLVGTADGPISAAPLEMPPPGWQIAASRSDPGNGLAKTGPLHAPVRPDAALSEQPVPAVFVPQFDGYVVINAPDSVADSKLAAVVDGLGAAGFAMSEPNRVPFTVKDSNVRYFHAEDAGAAAALADRIGAISRDFTGFSPLPPVGTLEVWLAGSGNGTAAPAKSGRKAPQRSASDERLINLRNRILQQLRNGEHL